MTHRIRADRKHGFICLFVCLFMNTHLHIRLAGSVCFVLFVVIILLLPIQSSVITLF